MFFKSYQYFQINLIIFHSLTHEDKTQFYVRIVTLLREYVMTARGHFEAIKTNSDITIYLTCNIYFLTVTSRI